MKHELSKAPEKKYLLKKYEINGLTISESMYPPRLRQPKHTHQRASFSFVVTGNYFETLGKQSATRQASTIIFHPPEESHAVEFQDNVRILNVHFDATRLAYLRENSIIVESSMIRRTGDIAFLGHRIHEEFWRMDDVSTLAIEGLILEILAETYRRKDRALEKDCPIWLGQIEDFLRQNFSQSLTVEHIAKIAGVHPVHLTRVFRRRHRCTVGEYIRRLRIEFACRQLSKTPNSLSYIALAAGFADQSHFSKSFKTILGLTPAEYRKNFKAGSTQTKMFYPFYNKG